MEGQTFLTRRLESKELSGNKEKSVQKETEVIEAHYGCQENKEISVQFKSGEVFCSIQLMKLGVPDQAFPAGGVPE